MSIQISKATVDDVADVAPLFNMYRYFYEQSDDLSGATAYLTARLQAEESVIFIAKLNGQAVGFTQLYPSFSSVRMARTWTLNDLFVHPDARRNGVGRALMNAAKEMCLESGAIRLELATGIDNKHAQTLYEDLGYLRVTEYYHYHLPVI